MRSHLGNRIGIGLTGLAMLVGAGYALVMRETRPQAFVLDVTYLLEHGWAYSIVGALILLFALVMTRWLLLALGWGRRGSRTGPGTAMLGVLLKDAGHIHRMRVRVVGAERVRVGVTCGPDADLAKLVRRLDPGGASRLRGTLELHDTPVIVRLHVRSA